MRRWQFESCDRAEVTLVLLPAVVAEAVFVLESFYRKDRKEIGRVLRDLIGSPGIELTDTPLHIDALDRYARCSAHFVDCAIAAYGAALKIPVASFDGDFKKFPDVQIEI